MNIKEEIKKEIKSGIVQNKPKLISLLYKIRNQIDVEKLNETEINEIIKCLLIASR